MIYLLVTLSLVFILSGFILTEKNAKNFLSGYNTMSEEEKKAFDLKGFVPFFRNFHIILSLSTLVFGLLIYLFVNKDAVGVFAVIYPILAYLYLLWKSTKFSSAIKSKETKIGAVLLVAVLFFVIGILAIGFKEDQLKIDQQAILIEGSYSEKMSPSEIESIEMVNSLPKIKLKTNGFALETIKKGHFKTADDKKVKLVINSDQKPIILFIKTDGQLIYYSAKSQDNTEILELIKKEFPNIAVK